MTGEDSDNPSPKEVSERLKDLKYKMREDVNRMKRSNFCGRMVAIFMKNCTLFLRSYLQNIFIVLFGVVIMIIPFILSLINIQIGSDYIVVYKNSDTNELIPTRYPCCGKSIRYGSDYLCLSSFPYLYDMPNPYGIGVAEEGNDFKNLMAPILQDFPSVQYSYHNVCTAGYTMIPLAKDDLVPNIKKGISEVKKCWEEKERINGSVCRYLPFKEGEPHSKFNNIINYEVNSINEAKNEYDISAYILDGEHRINAISYVMRALFNKLKITGRDMPGNVQYMYYFTQHGANIFTNFYLASALFLLPLAFSYLIPLFVSNFVEDSNDSLMEFVLLFGVKRMEDLTVRFIMDMIKYCIVLISVIGGSMAFQSTIFLKGGAHFYLPLCFLWGVLQIIASYGVAPAFSSLSGSTFLIYLLLLISSIVGSLLNMMVLPSRELPTWWYWWNPHWIFIRGMSHVIARSHNPIYVVDWHFGIYILALVFYVIFFGIFATQLPYSLFKFMKKTTIRIYYRMRYGETSELKTPLISKEAYEDEDVLIERENVMKVINQENTILMIRNLRKRFFKKVAVNDLCLSMKKGECFGLLGANGAGKTTLLNMLIGLLPVTEGTAIVGGYDITYETKKVRSVIGICPQFDILFKKLTVFETLLFFTRLRGVPVKQQKAHVHSIIEEVGLDSARRRYTSNLSGGMKRRLSIAMALIGEPAVLLLDEPTTGLDPASARAVWEMILKLKQNHCVILTSHSMEEVETLCDRVGIMANGSLKCVGPLLDLKNKHSDGYKITVQHIPANEENVKRYIASILPLARLKDSLTGMLQYHILSRNLKISKLFADMDLKKVAQYGIKDWSIDQASLEEVFIKFSLNHDVDPNEV